MNPQDVYANIAKNYGTGNLAGIYDYGGLTNKIDEINNPKPVTQIPEFTGLDSLFTVKTDADYDTYLKNKYGENPVFDLKPILGEYYDESKVEALKDIDTLAEYDYALTHPFTKTVEQGGNAGENWGYWEAGITDPENLKWYKQQVLGEDLPGSYRMAIDIPGIQGQNILRGSGNPYQGVADPRAMDNSAGMAQLYKNYGITPEEYSKTASNWAAYNTRAAQAARDDDGFGDFLGPALTIASFIPGVAPFAQAINAGMSLANGNPLGAVLSYALPQVINGAGVSSALGVSKDLGSVIASMGRSGVSQLAQRGEIDPTRLAMAGANTGLNQLFQRG